MPFGKVRMEAESLPSFLSLGPAETGIANLQQRSPGIRLPQEEKSWHQGNYGSEEKNQGRDEIMDG